MPVTRSSSSQPRPTPSPPRKHQAPEVIDLSPGPEPCSKTSRVPLTVKRKNKPQSTKKAPAFATISSEVIEISSDDEDDVPAKSSEASRIADLRRQMSKNREETVRYKKEYERASKFLKEVQEENKRLQVLLKPDSGKLSLDLNKLTENLDCEICTSRMWTPYILPDCGHSFCESCLVDWFGTIQAQFLQTHPEQDHDRQHNIMQLTRLVESMVANPALAQHPHMGHLLTHLMPQTPQYTCPSCRVPVRSRPTEVFAFKALARTISTAAGEECPKKPVQSRKGKAPAPNSGPWDGFFPQRKP